MTRLRLTSATLAAAAAVVTSLAATGAASAAVNRPATRPWAAPVTIGHTDHDSRGNLDDRPGLASASDDRGDIVVAWTNTHRKRTESIEVAMRRTGRALRRARTVYTHAGYLGEPSVAMDAHGHALVVFTQYSASLTQRRVMSVPVNASGAIGRAQRISAPGALGEQPAVAMSPSGAATIVFQRDAPFPSPPPTGAPDSVGIPDLIMAARRRAGARSFGASVAISGVDPLATVKMAGAMNPAVTMAADGSATAEWIQSAVDTASGTGTLQTATALSGGAFGAPTSVGSAYVASDVQLAGNPAGDAVTTWDDDAGHLVAAGRGASTGTFSAPATLLTDPRGNGSTVAVRANGAALITWGTGGQNQPGTLGTATWEPGGAVRPGSPIRQHPPIGHSWLHPGPADPAVVFSHGRPLVAWQELLYKSDGRDGESDEAKVSLEFATGGTPTTLGAGRLLLGRSYTGTSSGTLPGATLAGGGNGRVYEVVALTNGTVSASQLLKAR